MFQKLYAISIAILLFFSVTAISASAGFSPASLQSDGDAVCGKVRTRYAEPWTMPWQKRLVHWLCFPEYVDPH